MLSPVISGTGHSLQTAKPSHYVTSHLGQLSPAIPPWVCTMSTGDGYGHRQGIKRRVLRSSSPCDQDCWYADPVSWRRWPLNWPIIQPIWVTYWLIWVLPSLAQSVKTEWAHTQQTFMSMQIFDIICSQCTGSDMLMVQCKHCWSKNKLQDEKKRSERCKHCALAVVRRSQKFCPAAYPLRHKESALAVVRCRQKFRPTTDPLPGDAGRPKFNQLEMVTTFTYKPHLVSIDTCYFELSW